MGTADFVYRDIEWGYRDATGEDHWYRYSKGATSDICRANNFTLIAREVSEPRIVSIRA